MSGNPTLQCPAPALVAIQVDLLALKIEQPLGTQTTVVDSSQPFFVSATLTAGGFFRFLAIPYTIKYFFSGFGGAGSGTLGTKSGALNVGGVNSTGCPGASDYKDAVTRITVAPNTLTQDNSFQITAVADFSATPGIDAFITSPLVLGTAP
jgi:hypothetical protein